MAHTDRTPDFRELCAARPRPEAKRRKLNHHSEEQAREEATAQAYVAEGYTILKHISTLSSLLNGARRPYLNVDAQPTYLRHARNFDLTDILSGKADAFAGVKYLTNEERDQIDLQARMVLSKCAQRVKDMEMLEKRRLESSTHNINPLAKFLPARLLASTSAANSDFVSAHRTNITWYLTRKLADVSQTQKEMQEERIKRQTERANTLGSSAAAYEADMLRLPSRPKHSPSNSWSGASSSISALLGVGGSRQPIPNGRPMSPVDPDSDEEDLELTPGQILQFEQENAAILRSVEDTLAAVHQAESRLLEISALQSELIVQLTKQTEQIDHLYDEAITTQGEVEKGHLQLKQARERAKESRKWILAFILGATLAILFLHWYD